MASSSVPRYSVKEVKREDPLLTWLERLLGQHGPIVIDQCFDGPLFTRALSYCCVTFDGEYTKYDCGVSSIACSLAPAGVLRHGVNARVRSRAHSVMTFAMDVFLFPTIPRLFPLFLQKDETVQDQDHGVLVCPGNVRDFLK